MTLATGLTQLQSLFVDTTILQIDWGISLVLVCLTMLLITRDTQEWKHLALPVTLIYHIMGITPSIIWYMICSIMFAVNTLSIKQISTIITATQTITRGIATETKSILGRMAQKTHNKAVKTQAITGKPMTKTRKTASVLSWLANKPITHDTDYYTSPIKYQKAQKQNYTGITKNWNKNYNTEQTKKLRQLKIDMLNTQREKKTKDIKTTIKGIGYYSTKYKKWFKNYDTFQKYNEFQKQQTKLTKTK